MIKHYDTCHSDYPEKPDGELPRQIMKIPMDDGEIVFSCTDCGAYVVCKCDKENAFRCNEILIRCQT